MAPRRRIDFDPDIPKHIVAAKIAITDEEVVTIIERLSFVQVAPASGNVVFLDPPEERRMTIEVGRFSLVYRLKQDGSIYILTIDLK